MTISSASDMADSDKTTTRCPIVIPDPKTARTPTQKTGLENAARFRAFVEKGLEAGSLPMYNGHLNCKAIAKSLKFGRSAYSSNQHIADMVKWVERELGHRPRQPLSGGKSLRARGMENEVQRLKSRPAQSRVSLDEADARLIEYGRLEPRPVKWAGESAIVALSVKVKSVIWQQPMRGTVFTGHVVENDECSQRPVRVVVPSRVAGNALMCPGQWWHIEGMEELYQGAKQTRAHEAYLLRPKGAHVIDLLAGDAARFPGIGRAYARKLYGRLGSDLVVLLDRQDVVTLAERMVELAFPNAEQTAMSIVSGWAELGIGERRGQVAMGHLLTLAMKA